MKIKEKVLAIFARCNRWFDEVLAETIRIYDIFGEDETHENECDERIEKKKNKITNNQ